MAIGIRYYGGGTRPINRTVGFGPSPIQQQAQRTGYTPVATSTVDEDFPSLDFDDTGLPTGLTPTSSGSTAAAIQNAATNRAKFEAEQRAATAAAEVARTGAQAQADYVRALLNRGIDIGGLEEQIAAQEKSGQEYINTQYQNLLGQLQGRRQEAETLTGTGYDRLLSYLQQNPMVAYSQAARAIPEVTQNTLAQYMASRGIGAAPAEAGVDVANARLAAAAGNYNQLLNVLQAAEAQQQASRASEEQMARASANAQLQALYGGATAGLESQQLAALNELASRVSAARLENERIRLARQQALEDALGGLLGTGYVPRGSEFNVGTGPGGSLTDLEKIIAASGGTTTQPQFEQGIADLVASLQQFGRGEVNPTLY